MMPAPVSPDRPTPGVSRYDVVDVTHNGQRLIDSGLTFDEALDIAREFQARGLDVRIRPDPYQVRPATEARVI